MRLFACAACAAKDAEIGRLAALLQASIDRSERQASDLLMMARETAKLTPVALVPPPPVPPPPPLDQVIELFLDARFVYGTPLWRQQRREAEKLVAAGKDPEEVADILARGQPVEF